MSGVADADTRILSEDMTEFARVMRSETPPDQRPVTGTAPRINVSDDDVKRGLGRLVLALVRLLHELLERQAIRRMDSGTLTDDEIERLGLALMKQTEEIERLRQTFGLEEEDLNIDLGPLGKLL
ncbi:gas vesicle protein K [Candidatus Thiosymbion oneisti]|uniref:gas vesicle protein K n=1 Tax=Candidatus Thiosymbion oneisti TaxID=589554 RepID=UPI000A9F4482|nr:gas vesicle protein K [Candidatus Thiosymbion oneisti]